MSATICPIAPLLSSRYVESIAVDFEVGNCAWLLGDILSLREHAKSNWTNFRGAFGFTAKTVLETFNFLVQFKVQLSPKSALFYIVACLDQSVKTFPNMLHVECQPRVTRRLVNDGYKAAMVCNQSVVSWEYDEHVRRTYPKQFSI